MAGKIIKTLALILVISIYFLSGSDIAGTWNTGFKDLAPVPTLNVNAIKHMIEGRSYLEKEYRMTTSNILSTFDEAKFTKFAKDPRCLKFSITSNKYV